MPGHTYSINCHLGDSIAAVNFDSFFTVTSGIPYYCGNKILICTIILDYVNWFIPVYLSSMYIIHQWRRELTSWVSVAKLFDTPIHLFIDKTSHASPFYIFPVLILLYKYICIIKLVVFCKHDWIFYFKYTYFLYLVI